MTQENLRAPYAAKYAALRGKYLPFVQQNDIKVDHDWGHLCTGYNVQALPDPLAIQDLEVLKAEILALEPTSLYACPASSLHITIAWLIATRAQYATDKEQLWAQIAEECVGELQRVCRSWPPFVITYQQLIATDSAIIAVAGDAGEISNLRAELLRQLPIPKETLNHAEIIHTTLFRYRSALAHPDRLCCHLKATQLSISTSIEQLLIRKELVYPSLASDLICVANLGHR